MPRLHVVIPFYNEPATLEASVRRALTATLPDGWDRRLVLVDDRSTVDARNAALRMVEALHGKRQPVTLLHHDRNRGKGAAVQTGFDAVLNSDAADDDLVIIHDADLEYDPADFAALMAPLIATGKGERVDAVIGTRWGRHRPVRGLVWRVHRLGNGALTALSNLMTGYRICDMECCYKLLPVRTLRRLRPQLTEPRFGIEPQFVAGLSRLGARVAEVPVQYHPRSFAAGKKITVRDGLRAIHVIVRERFRRTPCPAASTAPTTRGPAHGR